MQEKKPEKSQEGIIFNKWLHNRLIKSNKNVLSAITGPTGCLFEDTIVEGQTKTLGDLYSSGKRFIDTVSITQPLSKIGCGAYYPLKSKSEIIDSGIKEVYEIELEDGRKVLATEDHKFFKVHKYKINEEIVKNLKVGDCLRSFPKDYYKDYLKKCKLKEQTKRDLNYDPRDLCKKCGTLFYQEKKGKGYLKELCKTCIEKPIKIKKDNWFEWEDNILRNFYYSYPKEKLMELIPRTWKGIKKRAIRLNLKRDPKFQTEQTAWTSEDNPIHNPILKEKMMQNKSKAIYKRNEMTSIEKKVAQFLEKNNINYNFNKVVRTKTSFRFPDFQIGDLIIECDGIYWHKGREKEDKAREIELKELGFQIIRFTDEEINNNWGDVEKCITQRLNQSKK